MVAMDAAAKACILMCGSHETLLNTHIHTKFSALDRLFKHHNWQAIKISRKIDVAEAETIKGCTVLN